MGSRLVLSNREDVRTVEDEEQLNFILSVLHSSGITDETLETCLTDGQILSIDNQITFRKLCERQQISIIDDTDRGIKVYIKHDNQDVLIAEWYKPTYVLRTDHSAIDRSKKLFVEINTSWWTIFEESDGQEK